MSKVDSISLFSEFGVNKAASYRGKEQRFLSEGDMVSFTSCRMSYNNAEFEINNCSNWNIWFSQLNIPLYNGEYYGGLKGLQFCTLLMKTGQYLIPCKSNPSDFWNAVKGKRFKVMETTQCYGPNKNDERVMAMSFGQIYETVHKALTNGRGESVRGMLKPMLCYDLKEI